MTKITAILGVSALSFLLFSVSFASTNVIKANDQYLKCYKRLVPYSEIKYPDPAFQQEFYNGKELVVRGSQEIGSSKKPHVGYWYYYQGKSCFLEESKFKPTKDNFFPSEEDKVKCEDQGDAGTKALRNLVTRRARTITKTYSAGQVDYAIKMDSVADSGKPIADENLRKQLEQKRDIQNYEKVLHGCLADMAELSKARQGLLSTDDLYFQQNVLARETRYLADVKPCKIRTAEELRPKPPAAEAQTDNSVKRAVDEVESVQQNLNQFQGVETERAK